LRTSPYSEEFMKAAVTIRLDADLERRLDEVCSRVGKTRSEVIREALRRQLAVMQFGQLRERIMPLAETQGYLTDEDVFRAVS
jgi:predicted transcriptional regulator